MNDMSFRSLPPPKSSGSGGGLDRFFARLMAWMVWGTLALMGLVFALSLLVWLVVMLIVSLVVALFTGRKPAVAVLWSRYRDLARQRWPQREAASPTPRADAASSTGASTTDTGVQDVRWREVKPSDAEPPRQP